MTNYTNKSTAGKPVCFIDGFVIRHRRGVRPPTRRVARALRPENRARVGRRCFYVRRAGPARLKRNFKLRAKNKNA